MNISHSIRKKITQYILLCLSLLIIFNITYWSYNQYSSINNLLTRNRTVTENNVATIISKHTNLLTAISNDDIVKNPSLLLSQRIEFVRSYQEAFNIEILGISDINGNAATTYRDSMENINYRSYFKQAIQQNKLIISNLIYSPISNSYIYIICIPFSGSINDGVIFASVSYAEIKKALAYQENTSIKNNILNECIAGNNNCRNINILKSDKLYSSLDNNKISLNIRNKKIFSYHAINSNHQLELLTLRPLKNTPWYLVSTLNYNQYLNERFIFVIINILISILTSVAIGYYLMKKIAVITSPIDTFIKESTFIVPMQSESKNDNININHHFNNIINTTKDGVYCSRTNLLNRKYFIQHANIMIQKRHNDFALLFIDLDNLKTINDTLGHHYGDDVIKMFAQHVTSFFDQPSDLMGRFGGDEFIVLTDNFSNEIDLIAKLQSLNTELSGSVSNGNIIIPFSASIGVALTDNNTRDIEQLIINADKAVYDSKKKGKNCYSFYVNH
ncbi:diguanylate cyclase domain-containing protein [Photobacterium phosphoreum]|uniref:diguanylate cyclase domain-containing protein n=1 Tax=Photobacterium phosphoreum TaxID=659 RepID=UPI001E5507AE|nr:diguanylate cyclase [Photobacterium phosphoreum]MCD9510096.1 diguanylate cyclase [Photobacterium phosphoreum]